VKFQKDVFRAAVYLRRGVKPHSRSAGCKAAAGAYFAELFARQQSSPTCPQRLRNKQKIIVPVFHSGAFFTIS